MVNRYVQYGCGSVAPDEWINYDSSPTLRIQRLPLIGKLLKNQLNTVFPSNVLYGDILKGLPVDDNFCKGIYCCDVLEHLSLNDFRMALKNTFRILQEGGIFRCVVPDLEFYAREYISSLDRGEKSASINFIGKDTILGQESRPKGFKDLLSYFLGNSRHLWMWDNYSLSEELRIAGFVNIRSCRFNDCEDKMFLYVEEKVRFENATAIECRK
jgi:hypothetical protein